MNERPESKEGGEEEASFEIGVKFGLRGLLPEPDQAVGGILVGEDLGEIFANLVEEWREGCRQQKANNDID